MKYIKLISTWWDCFQSPIDKQAFAKDCMDLWKDTAITLASECPTVDPAHVASRVTDEYIKYCEAKQWTPR